MQSSHFEEGNEGLLHGQRQVFKNDDSQRCRAGGVFHMQSSNFEEGSEGLLHGRRELCCTFEASQTFDGWRTTGGPTSNG